MVLLILPGTSGTSSPPDGFSIIGLFTPVTWLYSYLGHPENLLTLTDLASLEGYTHLCIGCPLPADTSSGHLVTRSQKVYLCWPSNLFTVIMSYNKGIHGEPIEVEDGKLGRSVSESKNRSSSHGGSMASSVLRFNDINFVVGKGDKRKNILENISGKVKWGRKLKDNDHSL